MSQTKPKTLAIAGLLGLALAYVFNFMWESYGQMLPGIPWLAIVGMMILSVVLLIVGLPIKKWNEGDRTRVLDPLKAARVAIMAKAAALAGASLTGWYAGSAVYLLTTGGGARSSAGAGMLLAVASAAVLMIVGLVVESFCQLPPDDPEGTEPV